MVIISTLIYNGTYLICSDINNYVQHLLDLSIYTQTQFFYTTLTLLKIGTKYYVQIVEYITATTFCYNTFRVYTRGQEIK